MGARGDGLLGQLVRFAAALRTHDLRAGLGDEVDAAISPDGRLTAFLSDRDGQMDAWISQIGFSGGAFDFRFLCSSSRVVPITGFGSVFYGWDNEQH